MIQIIAGEKGKGKTKSLIKMANEAVSRSKGHVIYIDDDSRHIYDLDYRIRFIESREFPINEYKEFFGFICGILSSDFDIDHIYIDGLLKMTKMDEEIAIAMIHKLKQLSEEYNVNFIISLSCKNILIPESLREYLVA